uniref:uncharacterized protein n=1 Tax=Myxine glutinosa TaxID=7769 RepID=UPI00358FF889
MARSLSRDKKRSFFEIPKRLRSQERRDRWLAAISSENEDRSHWSPVNSRAICSDHFVSGRPSKDALHPDYVPSIFPHRPHSLQKAEHSLKRYQRHEDTSSKRKCKQRLDFEETLSERNTATDLGVALLDEHTAQATDNDISTQTHETREQTLITNLHEEIQNLTQEKEEAIQHLDELKVRYKGVQLSSCVIKDNDAKSRFYTGLTWAVFLQTFNFFASHVSGRTKDSLASIDQFFITLVRLRLDLPFELISDIAACGETTVRDYFWKWIDVMYAKLSFLLKWPEKDAAAQTLPPEFKVLYPRLTGTVDCFEIFIENAGNLLARQQT